MPRVSPDTTDFRWDGLAGRILLVAYDVVMTALIMCVVVPLWTLACRLGRANPAVLAQHLGRGLETTDSVDLLIHAVAAGEMRAARALILQTLAIEPRLRIGLTTGTRSGYTIGTQLMRELSSVSTVMWLPFDLERILVPWLLRLAPKAMVVVETELWPNLFLASRKLDIPLAIASGRLYPGDVGRYRLIIPMMRVVLACPRWIWLQDQAEYNHYLAIGAKAEQLVIMGNAKFATPATDTIPNHVDGVKPLLVAVSTHAPEEEWLLRAFENLRLINSALRLVIAPRRIARVRSLARFIERQGWRVEELSDIGERSDWDVLLIDDYGQLEEWFGHAAVIFVGGSLVPKGGHDFVQAATYAKPLVVGPHLSNFTTAAERFINARALLRLRCKDDLLPTLQILLQRPALARQLGARARRAAEIERTTTAAYGPEIIRLIKESVRQ